MSLKLKEITESQAFSADNSFLFETANGARRVKQPSFVNVLADNNAGAHNSIYRGKFLGTSVSAEAYAAIAAGTFDPEDTGGLFIGDYWTINGVDWIIAAFDYWLHCGDTECTKHHVVIVPRGYLYVAQMHNTSSGNYEAGAANTTAGAYVGSDMYTKNLQKAKDIINAAFGAAHVLNHREHLSNAVANGCESAGTWYDSTVELMSEEMVYGCREFKNVLNAANWTFNYTISLAQLPLFRLDKSKAAIRGDWWLRDVASESFFCHVHWSGYCHATGASDALGVRPVFAICAA